MMRVYERKFPPTCTIDGCQKPHASRGWCAMHLTRWKRHGDPLTVHKVGLPAGHTRPDLRADVPGYSALHKRIRKDKGSATLHTCITCGGQATEWAYDHADPAEHTSTERGSIGFPYSTDLDHYVPMCRPCHRSSDKVRRTA
jgi:hypothetical protein